MSLPPVSDRAIAVLQEERKRLQNTHDTCAAVFGPNRSEAQAAALARIIDAVQAIAAEIEARTGADVE
ncbi:hypothetical protein [Sphingomonas sp. UYP23]